MVRNPVPHRRSEYLIALDIVRFIAAMMVLGLHLGVWAWWRGGVALGTIAHIYPKYPRFPELVPFLWFGWVGVQVFFVISGLVITMTVENSTAGRFARSRFLRIYPAVWICATLSLAIIAMSPAGLGYSILLKYFNTLIITPYPRWIDGVYWTLAIELVFYSLIFALIALGFGRNIMAVGIVCGLVSSLYVAGLSLGLFPTGWIFTLLLLRHGVFFATGMLVWCISRSSRHDNKWHFLVLSIFIAACIIEILHTASEKRDALGLQSMVSIWPPAITWLAMFVLIGSIVALSNRINKYMSNISGLCRTLGLATFPLYLTHQTVGGSVAAWLYSLGINRYAALYISITTSVTTSIFIAIILEPKIRRRFTYIIDRTNP